MELTYESQDLIAGQLNNSFNQIDNCEIIKPSWKGNKTYGETFFVKKRPSISESSINVLNTGDIVDRIEIDEEEFLLIHNGTTGYVAYFDGINFSQMGVSFDVGENTPTKFIKAVSGKGEIYDDVFVEDGYYDVNYNGTWDIATAYLEGNIVTYSSVDYIATTETTGDQPDTAEAYWSEYDPDGSGYSIADPLGIGFSDSYKGALLQIKLTKTNIRDIAIAGKYLLFGRGSNLQGVTTQIHFTETSYIDYLGNEVSLANDEVFVYVDSTNEYGTTPYLQEEVYICSEIGAIPIIAAEDKITSYHYTTSLGEINGAVDIDIYIANDGDTIVDMVEFDGVMFGLTEKVLIFSTELSYSNINMYPQHFRNNTRLIDKLVPFGKMLVGFGGNNFVATKEELSTGFTDYIFSNLIYNNRLYSKYSVLSTMGSLYLLQDDKQFVKLNIMSYNGVDYYVETENPIINVRGLFDDIVGDIYMNEYQGDIYVLDVYGSGTYYYKYSLEYQHWHTGDYLTKFYLVDERLYGDGMYELGEDYHDNEDDYRTQIVGFDFGGNSLPALKQVDIVKMIFGLNENILDYILEVEYQLGGIIFLKTIELKSYPINIDIGTEGDVGLGDSQLGTTVIGEGTPASTKTIGNFVSVTVGLGLTGSVFNFRIKSNNNGFIYGGSVIGYTTKLPTVTEFNYKH